MKIKGFVVLLSLFCASVFAAGFKTADELYENKEFEKAFRAYKNLATIGDTFSQYQLGYMYLRGEGVELDYAKAIAWMQVSEHNAPGQGAGQDAERILQFLKKKGIKADVASTTNALLSQYSNESIDTKFSPVPLDDKDCKFKRVQWLERKKPKYPRRALEKEIMGVVRLQFNTSSEGYPRDLEAIGTTDKLFSRPTVKSVKSWKANPSQNSGLQSEGYVIQLDYNLEGAEANARKIDEALSKMLEEAESGDASAQYKLAKTLDFWQGKLVGLGYEHASFKDINKWQHQAAQGGHPIARYELGKNMIQGKGCEEDLEGGVAWLRASAIAGYGPAQGELAKQLQKQKDSSLQEVIQLLRDASDSGHYLSSVNLAWLLATHPDPAIRNGKEALKHLDKEKGNYFDEIRILETKAAAYAALGKFRKAASYQDDAIDEAEDYEWDIPAMKQRYQSYKAKKLWLGDYYQ